MDINPEDPNANPHSTWAPDSWTKKTASQQPVYQDAAEVASVLGRLAQLPPLVTSWEIESLKSQLADAAEGKAFLLLSLIHI